MAIVNLSKNIAWDAEYCKFCENCVEFCPVKTLEIKHEKMIEKGKCIKCFMCEKYCPDYAIWVRK